MSFGIIRDFTRLRAVLPDSFFVINVRNLKRDGINKRDVLLFFKPTFQINCQLLTRRRFLHLLLFMASTVATEATAMLRRANNFIRLAKIVIRSVLKAEAVHAGKDESSESGWYLSVFHDHHIRSETKFGTWVTIVTPTRSCLLYL